MRSSTRAFRCGLFVWVSIDGPDDQDGAVNYLAGIGHKIYCWTYEILDANQQPIYVGVAADPAKRISTHFREAMKRDATDPLYISLRKIIEQDRGFIVKLTGACWSRHAALKCEAARIAELSALGVPLFNICHNDGKGRVTVVYEDPFEHPKDAQALAAAAIQQRTSNH